GGAPGGASDDVVGEMGGVATDAVDEVGVAVVLEALAQHVGPGDGGDAAALTDLTAPIEDRQLEPGVAAAVAGSPDDAANSRCGEVERLHRPERANRPERNRFEHLGCEAASLGVVVDAA